MTKIINPARVSISLLSYSTMCFTAVISYAALRKDGEFDITTVMSDVYGETMEETILSAYSGLRGFYYNISDTVPVVTFEGKMMATKNLTQLIEDFRNNPEKFEQKVHMIH